MSYQEDYMENGMMKHRRRESEQNARYQTKMCGRLLLSAWHLGQIACLFHQAVRFLTDSSLQRSRCPFSGFVFREIFQEKREE
ncbi:MAG: hypothetical protein ABS69_04300 [Nitrosomonadales bacterium SCN 54-20]|nr:MAG: hypothetical protein ABS69_04300 [Nitrosomonadales bacterium SCN 54-20]